jgi:hypothetical protein
LRDSRRGEEQGWHRYLQLFLGDKPHCERLILVIQANDIVPGDRHSRQEVFAC